MDFNNIIKIAQNNNCTVYENEPMSRHTTFGAGGTVSLYIESNASADVLLIKALKEADLPYMILGKGSNVLFTDDHHDMAVIRLDNREVTECDGVLTASAGTPLYNLSKTAQNRSLTGLEFAYGIPGSVGGAVYMNAGAYGGQMSDVLKSVTAICPDGEIRTLDISELDMAYRKTTFTGGGYVILSAEFKLEKGNTDEITAQMNELMNRRRDKQPLEFKSAGSTFKRPEGAFAGALIEQCGLKGRSVGDAQVSEKHAGFIINRGSATAAQIIELIRIVQKEVLEKTGFTLETEVEIINN